MSRLNELKFLIDERRRLVRAIARRQLAEVTPWLNVLSEADYQLAITYMGLNLEERPGFVANNPRLEHILSVWSALFGVGKPADLEAQLYPEKSAERERLATVDLERQRARWFEAAKGGTNQQYALSWLRKNGFEAPTVETEQPRPRVSLPQVAAPQVAKPNEEASTPALSLSEPVEPVSSDPEPRCLKCRSKLEPSRSNPARLVCTFCGFPVGDGQSLAQMRERERLWWDR